MIPGLATISAADIAQLIDFPYLINALHQAHLEPRFLAEGTRLVSGSEAFLALSAFQPGRFAVAKLVSIFPGNPVADLALPAVQGLVTLFDGTDGRPLAVIDGTAMTYWKTAADSALGAKFLAREDVRTLAVLGAGGLGPWLARAHCAAHPSIERVLIWNRTPGRARAAAELLASEGLAAEPVADRGLAVRRADIVSTATMSRAPIVEGNWLAAGAHLDLAGGSMPDIRESDDACARRAHLFANRRGPALARAGDFVLPIATGVIQASDISGDLYDLAAGLAGREDADDITLYKNVGGADLDLMTAVAIYRRYLEARG